VVHGGEVGQADAMNRAELCVYTILPEGHRAADAQKFVMCGHAGIVRTMIE
jgi:hypothetical protein